MSEVIKKFDNADDVTAAGVGAAADAITNFVQELNTTNIGQGIASAAEALARDGIVKSGAAIVGSALSEAFGQLTIDKGGVNKGGVDKGGVDKGGVDKGGVDKGGINKGGDSNSADNAEGRLNNLENFKEKIQFFDNTSDGIHKLNTGDQLVRAGNTEILLLPKGGSITVGRNGIDVSAGQQVNIQTEKGRTTLTYPNGDNVQIQNGRIVQVSRGNLTAMATPPKVIRSDWLNK
jgi:hypothetical protein